MTYNTAIISSEKADIVSMLEVILASEVIANLKIRNFHWNVESDHFSEMHTFFEWLYEESAENIDEIAERIRMLWSKTIANYAEYLRLSFLTEEIGTDGNAKEMIISLCKDKEMTLSKMREYIEKVSNTNDHWTEDFLIALMQKHEKNLWMLSSMKG